MHVLSLCLLTFLCFRTNLATGITRPFRPHHVARPLDKGQYRKTSASTTFSDIKITAADPTQEDVNGRLSSNWAGAVLEKLPENATYTYVAATITVPTATVAPSASGSSSSSSPSSQQAASAWVGLDGDTWPSAILQTGINFFVTEGKSYVEPWYEWYPDYSLDYDDFLINPGDVIVASVNATSTREGVCRIENLTTGLSATQIVSAPSSTATLKGWSAEWAVEDFKTAGNEVSFSEFNDVQFDGCFAKAGEIYYGVDKATLYDLVRDEEVLATSRAVNASELVISRT